MSPTIPPTDDSSDSPKLRLVSTPANFLEPPPIARQVTEALADLCGVDLARPSIVIGSRRELCGKCTGHGYKAVLFKDAAPEIQAMRDCECLSLRVGPAWNESNPDLSANAVYSHDLLRADRFAIACARVRIDVQDLQDATHAARTHDAPPMEE